MQRCPWRPAASSTPKAKTCDVEEMVTWADTDKLSRSTLKRLMATR